MNTEIYYFQDHTLEIYYMNNYSIIRDVDSNYYNLTKICHDNNVDINVVLESKWFNELTNSIINQLDDINYKTFEDLTFKLENGTHSDSMYRGIYGHQLFIIPLSSYCSMKNKLSYNYNYMLTINNIFTEINKNKYLIADLTLPINRSEQTLIIIRKTKIDKLYKITKSKDRKFLTNDDSCLTLGYINGDDVYDIFNSVMKKYNEIGSIKRVKSYHYYVGNIIELKRILDEIKLNTFEVNKYINVDILKEDNIKNNIITKLKEKDAKKSCLLGLLYEVFTLEYLKKINNTNEIYLWRNLPQKIINSLNVDRKDYGKDIIDVKNKIIYQCKYYLGSKLIFKNVNSFIKEYVSYVDLGFKFVLVCPSITTIASSVLMTLQYYNIEILRYEASEMLKLLEDNVISIETSKFNLNKYVVEHIDDDDESILNVVHNNYKTNFTIDDLNDIKKTLKLDNKIKEVYRLTPAKIKAEYVLNNWNKTDLELVEYFNQTKELAITMKGLEQIRRKLAKIYTNLILPYRSNLKSQEINEYIKENHKNQSNKELANNIKTIFDYDITDDGVNQRKNNLGLTIKKEQDEWLLNKEVIDDYVIQNHKTKTIRQLQLGISEHLNIPIEQCTYDRVRSCIRKIPLEERNDLTKREDVKQYILDHPGLTTDEYVKALKCSKTCILKYAKEIEKERTEPIIARQTEPQNKRSDIDEYILKFPGLSNGEYARRLKCSKPTIANHLKAMKERGEIPV